MSRWVDADAVKSIIRSGVSTDTEADKDYVCERIDEAPSIDIVRCRECSKRMTDDCPMCNMCNAGKVPTGADDFCSYGEREDE